VGDTCVDVGVTEGVAEVVGDGVGVCEELTFGVFDGVGLADPLALGEGLELELAEGDGEALELGVTDGLDEGNNCGNTWLKFSCISCGINLPSLLLITSKFMFFALGFMSLSNVTALFLEIRIIGASKELDDIVDKASS